MTFAEDRVLVAVINRKTDFRAARDDHWYRIPVARLSRGVQAEYLGFFLSGAFKEQNGAVHYYAQVNGLELVKRRWLLPGEADHPRADEVYYRIALGDLIAKQPPIVNTTRRTIAFIFTTWDRFIHARSIPDLYSKDDYFVDRIYHALRGDGLRPERYWEAERRQHPNAPGLLLMTRDGPLYACTQAGDAALYLDMALSHDDILSKIREAITRRGGPADISVPLDGR